MIILQRYVIVMFLVFSCVVKNEIFAQKHTDFKLEIKKFSDQLANDLKRYKKERIIVTNFTDIHGQQNELGRYIAQQVSINLIRGDHNILDRSTLDLILGENKITYKQLFDKQVLVKLSELTEANVIIVGTTVPFDLTISFSVTAVDISSGTVITTVDGVVHRNETLNALLRSSIKSESTEAAQTMSFETDPSENLIGERSFDLPRTICVRNHLVYGQVYFFNDSKKDYLLYNISGNSNIATNITMLAGQKNHSPLIVTGIENDVKSDGNWKFSFHTLDADSGQRLYASLTLEVQGCKVKVVTLNTNRLYFRPGK